MNRFFFAATLMCAGLISTAAPLRAAEKSKASAAKAEYVKKARVEFDELSARIDALTVKARNTGAAADKGLNKRIQALKAHRKTVKKDFAALKRAGSEAWADLRAGLDKAIADLKKELAEATKV